MDRDRYKKASPKPAPKKRSVNGEETYNLRHRPTVITPRTIAKPEVPVVSVPQPAPAQLTVPKNIPPAQVVPQLKNSQKQQAQVKVDAELPALFDEDDEDLFGVWKTQKDIKKARQEKEAKEKAAKLAAKMLKKEQNKVRKQAKKAGHDIGRPKRRMPKMLVAFGMLLLLLPLGFLGLSIAKNLNKPQQQTASPEVKGQTEEAKPDFAIMRPTTEDNQATTPKYDTTKKVVSYNDILADVPITVSQQPLPTAFTTDPTGQVEKLAKQINANDKISTSDTTAYAGISIKGPQTVVFTKNDLLVFIIANKKIDTIDWIKYIEKMI